MLSIYGQPSFDECCGPEISTIHGTYRFRMLILVMALFVVVSIKNYVSLCERIDDASKRYRFQTINVSY